LTAEADKYALNVLPVIRGAQRRGHLFLPRDIAMALNARDIARVAYGSVDDRRGPTRGVTAEQAAV
jgi:hypothetical protein